MKSVQKPIRSLVSTAVAALIASSAVHAGSFSLYTESAAVETSVFGAGAAAEAVDASTGWYNPAGLVLVKGTQYVFSGIGVFPSSKITGYSTFATTGVPSYVQTFNKIQGAENGFVPAFHFSHQLGENATFGLSAVAPFGLATSWPRTSAVRYEATQSRFSTFNLSPELGGRLNENFSVGGGIDLQYARVTFNKMLGSPAQMTAFNALVPAINATYLDSMSYNKGTSTGIGFHAGLMGMFNDNHTRLGLNYQSQVQHRFHGWSRLTGRLASMPATVGLNVFQQAAALLAATPNAAYWSNNLESNSISLPDILTLSGYHDFNERLSLLGSLVFTGWSSLKTIELNRVAAYSPNSAQVLVNSSSALNYKNVWRFSIGGNYHINQQWTLRAGGGYDQTPTVDSARDIRIPDADRWALAIGGHYQHNPNIGVDVGYTHLFAIGNGRVNKTDIAGSTSTYNVFATSAAHADIVGAQLVWTMDQPMVATK